MDASVNRLLFPNSLQLSDKLQEIKDDPAAVLQYLQRPDDQRWVLDEAQHALILLNVKFTGRQLGVLRDSIDKWAASARWEAQQTEPHIGACGIVSKADLLVAEIDRRIKTSGDYDLKNESLATR